MNLKIEQNKLVDDSGNVWAHWNKNPDELVIQADWWNEKELAVLSAFIDRGQVKPKYKVTKLFDKKPFVFYVRTPIGWECQGKIESEDIEEVWE
jgi:hypothetical protein